MRTFLDRLFVGRNGIDPLNLVILGVAVLGGVLTASVRSPGLHNLLYYVSLLALAIFLVRAFSRNLARRSAENQRFLSLTGRVRSGRESRHAKAQQKRQYKIFKCPSCGVKLRVPRGKGKIKVTCRQCGATFEEKS